MIPETRAEASAVTLTILQRHTLVNGPCIPALAALLATVLLALGAEFTPESAAAFAIWHNKDLNASRQLLAEAEGRLVQAGLWSNPEFQVRTEFDSSSKAGDRMFEGGFMQRFPWSGRLAQARTVARVDVAMAVEELRDRARLVAGSVLGKARSLLALKRKLEINAANAELLQRIFNQTSTLVSTGKGTVAEARVVELEQTSLSLARESLKVAQRAALTELNGLLGRDPSAPLAITGALPAAPNKATLQAAAAAALTRRPDRRLAALQVDRSRAEQTLARAQRWEDVGVTASLIRQRQDRMETTMLGVGLSIPLPLWNQNQGRLKEINAAQQRAAAALEALDLAIATSLQESQTRLTGLAAVFEQTRGPAAELARKTTELIEGTYATGSASFLTVFESRRQRLAIEQNAVDTQEQLATAITDWETTSGYFPPAVRIAIAGPLRE